MGGDAAKAATRSVRRELELTEMTSETSLLAVHLRPYSTASSSGILGASRLMMNRVSGRWLSLKPSKRQMLLFPTSVIRVPLDRTTPVLCIRREFVVDILPQRRNEASIRAPYGTAAVGTRVMTGDRSRWLSHLEPAPHRSPSHPNTQSVDFRELSSCPSHLPPKPLSLPATLSGAGPRVRFSDTKIGRVDREKGSLIR